MALDFSNISRDSLATLEQNQLIRMILSLYESNENFKKSSDEMISRKYDAKLEKLEMEINKMKQYTRLDTIEITRIEMGVEDEDIEGKTLEILKAADVKAGREYLTSMDLQAFHRKWEKK